MIEIQGRTFLVTGGTGFIGSALVKSLVARGASVRCFDNHSRGVHTKLGEAIHHVELVTGDIRDASAVAEAVRGVDAVCHFAYVNGTEFFYQRPEEILEVAVKGMMNVLDACLAHGVPDLLLASSSEVYQTADRIPTPEEVPLVVPDLLNPRYSYGGGKIISELLAINYGRKFFERVVIVRPHNVYGPDMGAEHVVPQFAMRMRRAIEEIPAGIIPFEIQGTGNETRSFIFIDDFIDGLMRVIEHGLHMGVYNIGTEQEIPIAELARVVAACFGRTIRIVPGEAQRGGALRRSPDISKLRALGFDPRTSLDSGIATTVEWYRGSCLA